MCIEYHIQVNMYHVSTQGVDERMINVHYYYYNYCLVTLPFAFTAHSHTGVHFVSLIGPGE